MHPIFERICDAISGDAMVRAGNSISASELAERIARGERWVPDEPKQAFDKALGDCLTSARGTGMMRVTEDGFEYVEPPLIEEPPK